MDYYSDSGHTFAKIFIDYDLPDYVKTADALDDEHRSSLSKAAFADQENRLFPILDPAQAYTSAAYAFAHPGNVSPEITGRIKQACHAFSIDSDVQKLEEHVASLFTTPREVKVAEMEQPKRAPFMIEFKAAGIERLEGAGAESAKKAEVRFLKSWPEIEIMKRTKIALSVIEALAGNGVEPTESTLKFAGKVDVDHDLVRENFGGRLSFVTDVLSRSAAVEGFNTKMANLSGAKTAEEKQTAAMEVVDFLGTFDANHKTAKFYGERFENPHHSVFNKAALEDGLIVVGRYSFPGNKWHGDGCVFDQAINAVLGPKRAAELKTASGGLDPEQLKNIADEEADLIKRMVG